MGYFAAFLICHMFFKHRFVTTGFRMLDKMWRVTVYTGLIVWAGSVAYSRWVLSVHVIPPICNSHTANTLNITTGIKFSGVYVSVVSWACRSTSSLNLFRRDIPHVLWAASNISHSIIQCLYGFRSVTGGRYGLTVEGKMHGCVGGQNGTKGSSEREQRFYNNKIYLISSDFEYSLCW